MELARLKEREWEEAKEKQKQAERNVFEKCMAFSSRVMQAYVCAACNNVLAGCRCSKWCTHRECERAREQLIAKGTLHPMFGARQYHAGQQDFVHLSLWELSSAQSWLRQSLITGTYVVLTCRPNPCWYGWLDMSQGKLATGKGPGEKSLRGAAFHPVSRPLIDIRVNTVRELSELSGTSHYATLYPTLSQAELGNITNHEVCEMMRNPKRQQMMARH